MSRQLALYRSGETLVRSLPGSVPTVLASALGAMVGWAPDRRGRRRLVATHMARAYGRPLSAWEAKLAAGRVYSNYARYWAETLRLPWVPVGDVMAGVTVEGLHHLDDALASGRGVVVAAPHLGGWEWGARYLVARGTDVTVAVEQLEPRDLFEWFVAYRRSLGVGVVPVGPSAGPAILRALEHNHVVCLLSDRVVGPSRGIEVEFFGERTKLPAGPVTVAVRSGARVVPSAIYFGPRPDDHHIVFRPPLQLDDSAGIRVAVTKGTQELAGELERLIRRAPEQWHMLQPNWPSDSALAS